LSLYDMNKLKRPLNREPRSRLFKK